MICIKKRMRKNKMAKGKISGKNEFFDIFYFYGFDFPSLYLMQTHINVIQII